MAFPHHMNVRQRPIKHYLITLLITPLLLLSSSFAHAQKWYQVEVIIFSQIDSFGEETNIPNVKLNYPAQLAQLHAPGSDNKFTLVEKSAWQLNPDAYTLNSTGVYKVLYHQAWRQPGIKPRNAPWLVVSGGKKLSDHRELEGSIRLHLSTYLKLSTNLWLLKAGSNAPSHLESAVEEPDSLPLHYLTTNDLPLVPYLPNGLPSTLPNENFHVENNSDDSAYAPNEFTPTELTSVSATNISDIYTLRQSERLQLGKTHYLDHPKMGLLVKVIRSSPPDSAASPQTASQSIPQNTPGTQPP